MNTNHFKTEGKISPKVSKNTYDIVRGPGRDRLFDSCKYARNDRSNIQLLFHVAEVYTEPPVNTSVSYAPLYMVNTRITGIEHEDGSGNKFNLKGDCLVRFLGDEKALPYRFTAFYDTNSRTGTITFYD